jgi:hypothetical protein
MAATKPDSPHTVADEISGVDLVALAEAWSWIEGKGCWCTSFIDLELSRYLREYGWLSLFRRRPPCGESEDGAQLRGGLGRRQRGFVHTMT